MLLKLLRRCARTRVAATVLSLVLCGAVMNWGHMGGDDPGCDPTLFVLGHSAVQIGAPASGPSPSDHCTLCHFLRLLQTAISIKSFAASHLADAAACRPPDRMLAPSLLAINLSSRAPPAILL
jgi:hypothetical protein